MPRSNSHSIIFAVLLTRWCKTSHARAPRARCENVISRVVSRASAWADLIFRAMQPLEHRRAWCVMAAINVWQNGTAHTNARRGADIRYGLLLLHTYLCIHDRAREMRRSSSGQQKHTTQFRGARWHHSSPHADALLNIIKLEKLHRKIVYVRESYLLYMLHAARKNYSSLTLFIFYEVWPRALHFCASDVDDGPLRWCVFVCSLSQHL